MDPDELRQLRESRDYSTSGKTKIDETILKNHGTGLSLQFLRILEITKLLGMMSEGANAWLKLCTKSRIHHHCSVGAATFRQVHRSPNLAQVPSDERIRKLLFLLRVKIWSGLILVALSSACLVTISPVTTITSTGTSPR